MAPAILQREIFLTVAYGAQRVLTSVKTKHSLSASFVQQFSWPCSVHAQSITMPIIPRLLLVHLSWRLMETGCLPLPNGTGLAIAMYSNQVVQLNQ